MAEEEGTLVSDKTSFQVTRPLVYTCIACILVDTFIVAAKTYSRMRIAKLRFWWDDFWIIPAYACMVPICALGIVMAQTEVAWNNEDRIIVNLEENAVLLKIIYAILQFLLASYAATRFSILALYLRIFSDRRLRRGIWALNWFVLAQWLAFALASLLQCRPVRFYWDRSVDGGRCIDVDAFYRSFTPINMAVDLALVVLPLPTVWGLQASRTRKWALTFLFGIGIAAMVASALRFAVYMTHTARLIAPSYTNTMILWIVVEPSIYLIAACLPAMHHIFAAAVPARIAAWMSARMARLSTTLGLSGHRPSRSVMRSLTSVSGGDRAWRNDNNDNDTEMGLDLTGQRANEMQARVRVEAGAGGEAAAGRDAAFAESWKGIMVTTEVSVTQEERIAQVIGF